MKQDKHIKTGMLSALRFLYVYPVYVMPFLSSTTRLAY